MTRTSEMQAVMDGMFPEQAANRAAGNCATCARPIDASLSFEDIE